MLKPLIIREIQIKTLHKDDYEGHQSMPPQNLPFWYKDYSELRIMINSRCRKGSLPSPFLPKRPEFPVRKARTFLSQKTKRNVQRHTLLKQPLFSIGFPPIFTSPQFTATRNSNSSSFVLSHLHNSLFKWYKVSGLTA